MILTYFLFGLIFGSFLNVLIYRWNVEKAPKFWQGRSFCPKCKHQLAWFDNIPLLSFILLKGKCRYCRKRISWQYPIVELITGLSTALIFIGAPPATQGELLTTLAMIYFFIVVFFSDLIYGLIPDEATIGLIIVGLFMSGLANWQSAIGCWAFFYLLYKITRERGIGFGDVKLAIPLGLILGWPNILVAMWIAFVSGGVWSLGLILLHRKKIHDTIVLGPFLILGSTIGFLYGPLIIRIIFPHL